MNNEPVAWMNSLVKWDIAVEQDITHDIPLYTHPAKTLTGAVGSLSDEEMLGAIARGWCSEKNSSKTMDSDLAMAIADEIKAILKKE